MTCCTSSPPNQAGPSKARPKLNRWLAVAVCLALAVVSPGLGQQPEQGEPGVPEQSTVSPESNASPVEATSSSGAGEIDEPASRPGDEDRALAEELAKNAIDPISATSLELARLELKLGRYQVLVDRLGEALAPQVPTQGSELPTARVDLTEILAEAHLALGQTTEAEVLYEHLSQHYESLMSRAKLARILQRRGERESADSIYVGLIRSYNRRPRLGARELTAVGIACRELGRSNPQLFKDALRAFDQAIESDPDGPAGIEARIELTKLFVEKYDSPQAQEALQPALAVENPGPDILLAAAMVERFEGRPTAKELALGALDINPNHVDSLVFLANLENEAEDRESASEYSERALEVNAKSLEALTVRAGLEFLKEDQQAFERVRDQVLQLHPSYADFWVELSLLAMRNRLYQPALDFAQAAVDLDPESWKGWGELGLNQLRLGVMEAGRVSLERAFAGDPYNVWIKNTLDLLDHLMSYDVVETEHFQIVLAPEESVLLGPIVGDLAERSYASLAKRYGYEPETPIRLEVFPSHEDFSVRTVGLSGLGALGVSFGPVIAIDSPAARGIGDFNWGTTLWHEIAHTFTLGLSKGKIPRWLTEGLSVYEERQGPVGWTDEPPPDFLAAYSQGKLLGLGQMNDGFVRPSFPNQIGLSYYQASIVAEYVEKTWGFEKIVEMVKRYGTGATTEEIVEALFELSVEEFDEQFWGYLDRRFATALPTFRTAEVESEVELEAKDLVELGVKGQEEESLTESPDAIELPSAASGGLQAAAESRPQDYRAQLAYGLELRAQGELESARQYLERARDLFPEYAGPDSPYHALAEIALELNERERAAADLQQLVDINEYDFEAHQQLADLYGELGNQTGELDVLSRSIYIYPYAANVHERIAELAGLQGSLDQRISSLRSVMALRPSGRARLQYEIAEAYKELGNVADAKRAVLGALELAPSYEKAQDLLLELIDLEAQSGGLVSPPSMNASRSTTAGGSTKGGLTDKAGEFR